MSLDVPHGSPYDVRVRELSGVSALINRECGLVVVTDGRGSFVAVAQVQGCAFLFATSGALAVATALRLRGVFVVDACCSWLLLLMEPTQKLDALNAAHKLDLLDKKHVKFGQGLNVLNFY